MCAGGANGIGVGIVQRLVNEGCSQIFVIDICPVEDRDHVQGFQVCGSWPIGAAISFAHVAKLPSQASFCKIVRLA